MERTLLRESESIRLGKSPSIKSAFPETISNVGGNYNSCLKSIKTCSFHVNDDLSLKTSRNVNENIRRAKSAREIIDQDIDTFSSISTEPSLVLYNNEFYDNASSSKWGNSSTPPSEILNLHDQGHSLSVVPEGKDIFLDQHGKAVGSTSTRALSRNVSNAGGEQSIQPSRSASSKTINAGIELVATSVDQTPDILVVVEAEIKPGRNLDGTQDVDDKLVAGEMKHKCCSRHVPLYLAALKGDWKTAKHYLKYNPHAVRAVITRGSETALHIAAGARHTIFVKKLVKRMTPDDLALQNKVGNTALCFAAASGITEIAKVLVNKNRNLTLVRGSKGATPLYMAVLLGQREMVWYLYTVTSEKDLSGEDRIGLLIAAITSNLYDVALELVRRYPELALARDGNGETALHVFSRKPTAFYSGTQFGLRQRCIYSCLHVELPHDSPCSASNDSHQFQLIIKVLQMMKLLLRNSFLYIASDTKIIYNIKLQHLQALELVKQLWKHILLMDDVSVDEFIRTPRRLLFTAAEFGLVEFITVLIRSHPDLIWKVDEQSRSIFHTAVAHRQEKVFNLINEIGSLKDFIALYKDEDDNNMLHLAAKLPHRNRLNTDSGAALQLRRELIWFKEVEKIVQPLYAEMKNSEGRTPQSLFSVEHKKLLREGEKWMKETASSCMVVAALIATVMFAAAFTLPGGNNEDTGIAIFLETRSFIIFVTSDLLALFSSTSSIVIFLSILTSRYAEEDFLRSLPNKLIMGLATLFISIATMMIAFTATLFIVLGHEMGWSNIPITVVASIPVLLFAILQFPLVADMISNTYRANIFFHSSNRLLS